MTNKVFFIFSTKSLLIFILAFCVNFKQAKSQSEKKDVTKKIEFHLFDNDELIKKAITILKVPNEDFLAQLRGVDRFQKQFNAMNNANSLIRIPNERVPGLRRNMKPIDSTKVRLDYAKNRVNALKKLQEQLEKTQEILLTYRDKLVIAKAASVTLGKTYETMKFYLYEINLRINDRTLLTKDIPKELMASNINIQKLNFARKQNQLAGMSRVVQNEQNKIAEQIKEIEMNIVTLESKITPLENNYSNELKRQNIEKKLSLLSTKKLVSEFTGTGNEFKELKNAFDISVKKLNESEKRVEIINNNIDSLTVPSSEKISQAGDIKRCEEAEQTIIALKEIMNYQKKQLVLIKELKPSINKLLENTNLLEKEIPVIMVHLFKMRLIHSIVTDRMQNNTMPEIFSEYKQDSLLALRNELTATQSRILTEKENLQSKIIQINDQVRLLEPNQKEMEKQLEYLGKIHASIKKNKEWETKIKEMKPEKIVNNFSDITSNLNNKQKELEKKRKEYEKKQADFTDVKQKYESLQDPLLLEVKEEIFGEKQHIVNTLYLFANIKFTDDITTQTGQKKRKKEKKKSNQQKKEPLIVDLESYQNLISTQFELIYQKEQYEKELSEKLTILDENINLYMTELIETYTESTLQQKTALAMKLKLSKKELNIKDIPENYKDVLSSDNPSTLEKEIIKSFNKIVAEQLSAHELLTNLNRPDATTDSIEKFTAQISGFVGNKYDILKQYQDIKQETEKKSKEVKSEVTMKRLERQAENRLADDDNIAEFILGSLQSSKVESSVELMKVYYIELLELEKKKKNMEEMKLEIEQLTQLSKKEFSMAEKLIPLLKTNIAYLENQYAEELARVHIRLNPDIATKIMQKFEKENGYRFSMPTPVAKENISDFIKKTANKIYELKAIITAQKKELDIFEQRLNLEINNEIDVYQNELDLITFENANIQRRIRFIAGRSDDEQDKIISKEIPDNKIDKIRFYEGELGVLRAERTKSKLKEWIMLVIKLLVIIALAIALNKLITYIIGTLKNRTEKQGKLTSQSKVLYSLILAIIKFTVWVMAVILVMSSAGINVAAILTGLGIGGLAIAMASKETVSNFLGGLTIFMSKPFKIGDFIKYKGKNAVVEDITFRYTKLRRMPTNDLIIMPNSHLAETEVINVTEALGVGIRHNSTLPLSILNSLEKVKLAEKLIKDIVEEKPNVKMLWFKLNSFENHSFELAFRYLMTGLKKPGARHRIIAAINLEIIEKFEENNIEFAVKPHKIIENNTTTKK